MAAIRLISASSIALSARSAAWSAVRVSSTVLPCLTSAWCCSAARAAHASSPPAMSRTVWMYSWHLTATSRPPWSRWLIRSCWTRAWLHRRLRATAAAAHCTKYRARSALASAAIIWCWTTTAISCSLRSASSLSFVWSAISSCSCRRMISACRAATARTAA